MGKSPAPNSSSFYFSLSRICLLLRKSAVNWFVVKVMMYCIHFMKTNLCSEKSCFEDKRLHSCLNLFLINAWLLPTSSLFSPSVPSDLTLFFLLGYSLIIFVSFRIFLLSSCCFLGDECLPGEEVTLVGEPTLPNRGLVMLALVLFVLRCLISSNYLSISFSPKSTFSFESNLMVLRLLNGLPPKLASEDC